MAKQKQIEPNKVLRPTEEDLIFWESHLLRITDICASNPSEENQEWKQNVITRIQNLKNQINSPAPKSTKLKF